MRQRVAEQGLADRFLFLGDRPDVPQLMMGAMDAFLFPSLYEGLPRVLLEAQAAGLPCAASDTITREAAASPSSIRFLPLNAPIPHWCDALESALNARVEGSGPAAIADLEARGLTIAANARKLVALYRELRNPCRQPA
jgi:glycosyltransferase involved in cell wall biosynthesis